MRLKACHAVTCAVLLATPAWAQTAFISNTADNTVSIIDTPSGTVIGAVPVGLEPQGVAVAPNGTTAYVTNLFGNNVSVIDAARFPQVVTASIKVGAFPPGVALSPDGSLAYVTSGLSSAPALSVINTTTNRIIATIALPDIPAGVAVAPDGAHVYALTGSSTSGSVSVITTATHKILRSIPIGPSPFAIAITPNGARAYVTQSLSSGTVTVLNLATNATAGSIKAGRLPIGVAVSPDGTKAYVANNGDNSVSVIGTKNDTVAATIMVGQGPFGVSFTPDGKTALVANKTDNTVSKIDVASESVIATVAVGQAPAALGSNFIGKAAPASAVQAVVLSGSGPVTVGSPATFYASMRNIGTVALKDCRIVLPSSAPDGMTMTYVTVDPTTLAVTSGQDPKITMAAKNARTVRLTFKSVRPALDPAQPLLFLCDGTTYAPIIPGSNVVDLWFSGAAKPDIDAVAATAGNTGVVEVPLSHRQAGAFAVATENLGAAGTLTVTTDTGGAKLPVSATLCQTNVSGQCLHAPATAVTLRDAAKAMPTFSVFVTATGRIALNPAGSRLFVRFVDANGISYGTTSVAVATD